MANLLLAYPNQVDAATLSSGSYVSTLPLTNLQDRRISKKARTTGLGVSRTASATYYNQSGVLSTALANTLRFNYNPADLTQKGAVLTEEASTNYTLYAADLTNAVWTKTRATVTANSTTGLDGAVTVGKLVEDTTATATHLIQQIYAGFTSGISYTLSVHIKAAERTAFRLLLPTAAFGADVAYDFDLSTPGYTLVTAGTSNAATIKSLGNSWYRCSITATATVTASASYQILLSSGGSITYSGNGTSGIYLDRIQLEPEAIATSFIPTTSVAATRDTDVLNASFRIALDKPRPINVIAAIGHNLSSTAQMRVRGNDTNDFTLPFYDSGWFDVWTDISDVTFGTLAWESDSFWTWKISDEEAAYYPGLAMHLPNTAQTFRYWWVEFYDPSNQYGYVEVGRVFIGASWTVTNNVSFGWGMAYEDGTIIEEALGGSEYYDYRPKYRTLKIALDNLTSSEALTTALGLSRVLGVSGEVLMVWNRDDYDNIMRRSFLGRLRTLSAIENPDPIRYQTTFEIKEIIA